VEQTPEKAPDELLSQLRRSVLDLDAPGELVDRLPAEMDQAGLCRPVKWDEAWMCIKRVWASKWNERAYLSRRAQGISHDDLFMAVLIQEVVEAEYSFVIHTNNPITGNRDEIYAEVVPGLGETLVGNYPGRALSFTSSKAELKPQLLAFPGKSIGLFGSGLIFRSDSNGEDLPEYAGAGLYDSVILPAPQKVLLDYELQPLVWDEQLQTDLLRSIADIGRLVEKTLGSAQDIEGAYCQGRYFVVQTRPQVGLV
jgi:alpha-glucan,water dikinase